MGFIPSEPALSATPEITMASSLLRFWDVLYKRLLPILNHERVILADGLDSIHLAKVRGGLKLWRLYEALKVL
jgi:hypothetical protein